MARKFINVPLYSQPPGVAHCGIASLRMVLAYHGKEIVHWKLAKQFSIGKYGVDPQEILKVSRDFGFRGYEKSMKLENLITYIDQKQPIIIRTRVRDPAFFDHPFAKHITVVRGYDTNYKRFYINDPNAPSKYDLSSITFDELSKLWLLQGKKSSVTRNRGIVITPKANT